MVIVGSFPFFETKIINPSVGFCLDRIDSALSRNNLKTVGGIKKVGESAAAQEAQEKPD